MKLLVVDDDLLVHSTVKSILERNDCGFAVAGDAFNGQEAFDLFTQLAPEAVLTDMKMPVADGLTFMRWVAQSGQACKVIVLSGYDDFSYTRPAFLQGAVDYLLKPVNEVDLVGVLTRTAGLLEREGSAGEVGFARRGLAMVQEQFLSEITFNDTQDENTMIVKAHQHKLRLPQEEFQVGVMKLQNTQQCLFGRFDGDLHEFYGYIKEQVKRHFPAPSAIIFRQFYKTNEFVVLHTLSDGFSCEGCMRNVHDALAEELGVVPIVGLSAPCGSLEELPRAYRQAAQAMLGAKPNARDYLGRHGAPLPSDPAAWREVLELIDCALENKSLFDGQGLCRKLERVLGEEYAATLTVGDIVECAGKLVERLGRMLAGEEGEEAAATRLQLEGIPKYLEQLNVRRALGRLRDLLPGIGAALARYSSGGEQFIADVERYIEEHCRKVDLSSISAHFYLNKNYFSTLFKVRTSKTFSDYLLEVRMRKAAFLLENTALKIYEVSQQVGYDDARYFSQVFKKAYGMQPSEYRQQRRGAR